MNLLKTLGMGALYLNSFQLAAQVDTVSENSKQEFMELFDTTYNATYTDSIQEAIYYFQRDSMRIQQQMENQSVLDLTISLGDERTMQVYLEGSHVTTILEDGEKEHEKITYEIKGDGRLFDPKIRFDHIYPMGDTLYLGGEVPKLRHDVKVYMKMFRYSELLHELTQHALHEKQGKKISITMDDGRTVFLEKK